jgi:hypothetical protein
MNSTQADILASDLPSTYTLDKDQGVVVNEVNLSIFSTGEVVITCSMLTIKIGDKGSQCADQSTGNL